MLAGSSIPPCGQAPKTRKTPKLRDLAGWRTGPLTAAATVLSMFLAAAPTKATTAGCTTQPCSRDLDPQGTSGFETFARSPVDRKPTTARDLYWICLNAQMSVADAGWCAAYQHMIDDEPRVLLLHVQVDGVASFSENPRDDLKQIEVARC